MASFSQITVVGNVTRDIELRHTGSGTAVCTVSLAVNHKYYNKNTQATEEDVCYIDCDCFGRTAENAAQYLSKGSMVLFSGRLGQDTWQDKQTNQNRSKHKISVSVMTMLGGKGGGESQADSFQGPAGGAPDDDCPF